MPKGTTSKETVETGSYGKKPFFLCVCVVKFPDFLGSASYMFMYVESPSAFAGKYIDCWVMCMNT